jgi:hypothetical protein
MILSCAIARPIRVHLSATDGCPLVVLQIGSPNPACGPYLRQSSLSRCRRRDLDQSRHPKSRDYHQGLEYSRPGVYLVGQAQEWSGV